MKTKYLNTEIVYDNTNFYKKFYDKQSLIKTYSFSRYANRLLKNDVEAANSGIYFVFSTIENKIYVGKSDNGIYRIFDHDKNKDFWNRGMLFTSSNWGPNELSFLEYYFINYFQSEEIETMNIATVNKPNIDFFTENQLESTLDNIIMLFKFENSDIFRDHYSSNESISKETNYNLELNTSDYPKFKSDFREYAKKNNFTAFSSVSDNSVSNSRGYLDLKYPVKINYGGGFQLHRSMIQIYIWYSGNEEIHSKLKIGTKIFWKKSTTKNIR